MPRRKNQKKSKDNKQDREIAKIKRQINAEEMKNHQAAGTQAMAAAGLFTVVGLSEIAQGLDYSDRIGRDILCKKMKLKCYVKLSASTTTDPSTVRICVVRDTKSDGAVPTYINVFGSTNELAVKTRGANQGRFQVLYDKTISKSLAATGVLVGSFNYQEWNQSYKVGSRIKYSGTASNNYGNNGLYLMCGCNDTTYPPALEYRWSMDYTDN